jgi:hypothetical protein
MKPIAVAGIVAGAVVVTAGLTYALTAHTIERPRAAANTQTQPTAPTTLGTAPSVQSVASSTVPPTSAPTTAVSTPSATPQTTAILKSPQDASPVSPPSLPATSTTAPFVCPTGTIRWVVTSFTTNETQPDADAWEIDEIATATNQSSALVSVVGAASMATASQPSFSFDSSEPTSERILLQPSIDDALSPLQPGQSRRFEGTTEAISTTAPTLVGGFTFDDANWLVHNPLVFECPPPTQVGTS